MGKNEKKFLIVSVVCTVITIIIMTIVAVLLPKEKFTLILIIEILLALVWTAVFAINTISFLKKNKRSLANIKDDNNTVDTMENEK